MDIAHELPRSHADGEMHKITGGHNQKLVASLRKVPAERLSQLHHAITYVLKEKAQEAENSRPPHLMSDAQFARWSKKMMNGSED